MSRRTSDELFEQWWLKYPRKIGKLAAKKVWDRIRPTPEQFDKMTAALDWQVQQDGWRDARFIPHPTTYLNAGRWLDEPSGGAVAAVKTTSGWVCRHVEECSNREMCAIATTWKRPEKALAS